MSTCCKGVIFDLDGTLLDTILDLSDSMNRTLEHYGLPVRDISHHKKSVGNGIRKYSERCIPKDMLNSDFLDEFVSKVVNDYRINSMVKTKPFDGILELLTFLEQNGIVINILSNKRDDFVKELTLHYFKNFNFKCAVGELSGISKKPSPDASLKIAKECGLSPCEIIFIGDSIYDIQTGKNSGMKTIAVTWGYQPESMLLSENPDFIANHPQDIINYIKNNY